MGVNKLGIVTPKGKGCVGFAVVVTSRTKSLKPSMLALPPPLPYNTASEGAKSRDIQLEEACEQWGIDRSLQLWALAADFYTLCDLDIDYPNHPDVMWELKLVVDALADQFSRYLDMVIGGELRHVKGQTKYFDHSRMGIDDIFPPKLHEAYLDIEYCLFSTNRYSEREACWSDWKNLRDRWGLDALKVAKILFGKFEWDKAYGGESWANATDILIMYYTGKLSPTAFVDTAWGLHHNNEIIYDKVWNLWQLDTVLGLNLDDNLEGVAREWASTKIRRLRSRIKQRVF